MEHSKRKRLKMGDPATYLIYVQGCLDEVWSDRLANMTIKMDLKDKQAPVTILQGRIRDQTELLEVLNGLYQMRVPILFVEVTNGENEASPSRGTSCQCKDTGK